MQGLSSPSRLAIAQSTLVYAPSLGCLYVSVNSLLVVYRRPRSFHHSTPGSRGELYVLFLDVVVVGCPRVVLGSWWSRDHNRLRVPA